MARKGAGKGSSEASLGSRKPRTDDWRELFCSSDERNRIFLGLSIRDVSSLTNTEDKCEEMSYEKFDSCARCRRLLDIKETGYYELNRKTNAFDLVCERCFEENVVVSNVER